jgi:hypothetical protein
VGFGVVVFTLMLTTPTNVVVWIPVHLSDDAWLFAEPEDDRQHDEDRLQEDDHAAEALQTRK